jgi:hypothetical protein
MKELLPFFVIFTHLILFTAICGLILKCEKLEEEAKKSKLEMKDLERELMKCFRFIKEQIKRSDK